ncbi:hypothetical protein CANARDRAFT_20481 [[Candida] arabinofermentans NRRL YB-2248]|uniref:Mitochondrial fusion and transport protein UGO1 n=1 Tax=[Candida] arabinofermentans NRRL YB-2248 TaxID=983967 RepID=A0A1E4T7Q6_9ASCO|nr:hypothetical protein CANARDRAFT_20481 [[Candida] arabinofermentans NRRL YB-2248]
MNSKDNIENSFRPYKNKFEFDSNYPISYKPYLGIIDNNTNQSISTTLPFINQQRTNGGGGTNYVTRKIIKPLVTKPSINYYKKNIYSDLEFKEYFELSNLKQLFLSLINSFTSNYFKLLVSQPFEVSCILLQVGSFEKKLEGKVKTPESSFSVSGASGDDEDEDEDDEDDVNYFQQEDMSPSRLRHSHIETSTQLKRTQHKKTRSISKSQMKINKQLKSSSIIIEPNSLNMFDVISATISKEGPRGILKAVNTSFLMNTIQYTIESWVSGFLSGLLNIPDPLFVELIHSPNVNLSLTINIVSNLITNLLIQQISLIRLRFIVTSSNKGIRSFREILWKLPKSFLFKPSNLLILPNIITNLIKSLCIMYPNYLLISKLQLNKYNYPVLYNLLLLIFKIIGLFIKLPFETIYNRAQLNYLLTNKTTLPSIMQLKDDDLCIKFGGYYGYFSTFYYIIMGLKPIKLNDETYNNEFQLDLNNELELNKGFSSLFHGWKIGLLRLVSRFALNLLSQDEVLSGGVTEEKF